jgi:hypothetical protein
MANQPTNARAAIPRRDWLIAAAVLAGAAAIYWLSAALLGRTRPPVTAYFDQLSDAFLHGRLYLANPLATDDLTQYAGRWYVPFPPLPALLLLPWVAVAGLARVNTVLFCALIGGVNVALAFLLARALARRGWSQLGMADSLWLAGLLGLGSVHWYMATLGSVWFVGQVCTLAFILLAAWLAAETGHPLAAGAALAAAMLGRPTVALCYPLLLAIGGQIAADQTGGHNRRAWLRWAIWSAVPPLFVGALLLAYNQARFGSPLDFGYMAENVSPELRGDLRIYGQFNLHYLPHNLWAMLLAGPRWDPARREIVPTVDGMSLLLTTPALLYLFRPARGSALALGAWLAIGLVLVPLLTYYNTGWWQFGYRFSLDFMTPVLVLLAIGAGPRLGWRMRALIAIGALVNAWGCWWFLNPRYFSF